MNSVVGEGSRSTWRSTSEAKRIIDKALTAFPRP